MYAPAQTHTRIYNPQCVSHPSPCVCLSLSLLVVKLPTHCLPCISPQPHSKIGICLCVCMCVCVRVYTYARVSAMI